MESFLRLEDVSLSYHTMTGAIPALSHLSFSVKEEEFIALVGPSGCGKSTILNLIAGLIQPEDGTIQLPESAKDGPVFGYMFQRDRLFEWRTIYENVILGLEIRKKKTASRLALVERLLQDYGLAAFRNARPSQLSGGMRQRAALIRTLALDPALLLLDEPFSALDYQTRLQVSDDIWQIIRKEHKTALLVTHDISEAISMASRVIVLTAAPASVRCQIPIRFLTPVSSPMEARNTPEFKHYFQQIWKELNIHDHS